MAALTAVLPDRVEAHYGPDQRVAALRGALAAFRDDPRPVDAAALVEVEAAAQTVFRHLELTHRTGLTPQEHSPGWPDEDLAAVTRSGANIPEVRRGADGTGVIRLTGLAPIAAAARLLTGAFTLMRGASRVVLDLRDNRGGDPATVVFIVDWLAANRIRHCFDVRYRNRVRPWWTSGASSVSPPEGEVRALIGPRTYSSGEALAWTLQNLELATLLGSATAGAADHVVPLALTHDVSALLPEGCVLAPGGGPTWEAVGVQPDEPAGTP